MRRRLVREVLLKLDRIPVVEARSECRIGSAFWQNILDCGTRPLGERLFQADLEGARSAFEFAVSAKDADGTLPRGVLGFPVTARKCC